MYERAEFVDTRGKKIRMCIEILSCFLNATPNIFHSITNVTYSMDYFRVTKLSKARAIIPRKKKEKGVTSNFFPFQRHSDFHEYRIHQSPRTFSEFYIPFCLSSLRKFPRLCYSCKLVTRPSTRSIPSGRWWKDGSRLL